MKYINPFASAYMLLRLEHAWQSIHDRQNKMVFSACTVTHALSYITETLHQLLSNLFAGDGIPEKDTKVPEL